MSSERKLRMSINRTCTTCEHSNDCARVSAIDCPWLLLASGVLDQCCGVAPIVTEWRPGCYGAECRICGRRMGNYQQLEKIELMLKWNRAIRRHRRDMEALA